MKKPEGKIISIEEADEMIGRYKDGKVVFRPGKETGCFNAATFDLDFIRQYVKGDFDKFTVFLAGDEKGNPTIVFKVWNSKTKEQVAANDGLTCPPFEICFCIPC